MSIPRDFVQDLLQRIDIVEVVARHVALKKSGGNFFGLCPFHGEKSPSFSVSPAKQIFHCFGCGKNGDAIGFLIEHTGASFVEAVQDLAQQVGLNVPQADTSPQQRAEAAAQREQVRLLADVLEQAARAYQSALKSAPKAIDYLKRRGVSGATAKAYGLGYAPVQWRHLSTVFPDYASESLVQAGLVIATEAAAAEGAALEAQGGKRYDRFRDRIMFPIRNVKGQCIGFGARVLGAGEPKYLNSPETALFSKGRELYGLFEARSAIRAAGCVLVTEGYMDVVTLAQHGLGYAVATLGTACTTEQVRLLFRFSNTVVFAFDGDAAGRRAAHKALQAALPWASDTRQIRFLFLPPEHDPDSFVRAHGAAAFEQALQTATPLSRYLLQASAEGCALDTPEGRARMASQAQPLWSSLPEGLLKRQLLNELAEAIQLEPRDLLHDWQRRQAEGARQQRRASGVSEQADAARSSAPSASPPARLRVPTAAATPAAGASAAHDAGAQSARNSLSSMHSLDWGPGKRASRRRPRGLLDRADRVARLVLSHPQAWDWLSADDIQLLAQQPAPHGGLFTWLESQWLEHGPQPWAALRSALHGQAFEALAQELQAGALLLEPQAGAAPTADARQTERGQSASEAQQELARLVHGLRIEQLKAEESALIERAKQEPELLHSYRERLALRVKLQNENMGYDAERS